ncbi:DivIVA domain-containing protein [Mycoplasma yeatsii]|uniref:DivIVA domain-containing protein n=2 Tax=Mycoplasma yeatsii TaxID=51365 RepID=S6G8M5_9MOLU|nr:DivIVA domain-containing protein [Mycoplasma yeatsii]EOA07544.1 Hypothetical protein, DivIVA family [Mycoplasma yeatsii 13926]MDQ0568035.1 cell division initiation protein [Mycoplasma yeatsii]
MTKKFTISQIQNKKFNIVYKGYKAEEVNDFLDEIISDYMYFEQKIHDLKNELDAANEKLENISNKNDAILVEIQEYRKQNWDLMKNTFGDADIIKRISRIENNLVENEQRLKKIDEIYTLLTNKK